LAGLEERRVGSVAKIYTTKRDRLRDLSRALPRPEALLNERRQRLDAAGDRLPRVLAALAQRRRIELGEKAGRFGPALLSGQLNVNRERVRSLSRVLQPAKLAVKSNEAAQALDRNLQQFRSVARQVVTRQRERLDGLERLRETLGYRATLARGYAVVRGQDGAVVGTAEAAKAHKTLEIEFADDRINTAHLGDTQPKPSKAKTKPAVKPKDDQGSLF